ncbi:aldolase-type TIM barrel protein [Vibrio phage 1.170.O._10N.261.52.C3]|nr:aldolase-type TIM barrel protein [Vibrio phage 1.170.O._10N.261.52.C3]
MEGGGKSFDSESLIEQRKRAIYNVFGCGHLLLGEKGGGSYNLHEGMTNNLYFYIERTTAMIEEVLNKDLVRQLFRLNEWDLTIDQIPKIKAGDITPISLEEKGKYINRVARMLPATPYVVNMLLKDLGIQDRIEEDASADDIREMLFTFEDPSKVGISEGSSGEGDSQQGGSQSDTNSENKA